MAAFDMHKSPRCQHVHYNGKPCQAPARRARNYCVFHQAAHLDPGGCTIPVIEDLHSYQIAIIRIMQSLAADTIDSKKATALLYALQLLGGRLSDFAKQREEVESPALALRKEIEQRYEARRHSVPTWIPEREVIAILKEMRAEPPAEPNDSIAVFPQSESPVILSDAAPAPGDAPKPAQSAPDSPGGVIDSLEACDGSVPLPLLYTQGLRWRPSSR